MKYSSSVFAGLSAVALAMCGCTNGDPDPGSPTSVPFNAPVVLSHDTGGTYPGIREWVDPYNEDIIYRESTYSRTDSLEDDLGAPTVYAIREIEGLDPEQCEIGLLPQSTIFLVDHAVTGEKYYVASDELETVGYVPIFYYQSRTGVLDVVYRLQHFGADSNGPECIVFSIYLNRPDDIQHSTILQVTHRSG